MIASMLAGGLGMMGANSAASAAEAAAQQQREANALARKDLSPWRAAGAAALNEMAQLQGLGSLVEGPDGQYKIATDENGAPLYREGLQLQARNRFMADPGYQFRVAEGEKGLNRSLAAKTGVLNGAAVKAAMGFNQDQASEEYGNYFNRMMGLSGAGGGAASTTAQVGVAGARAVGDDLINAGQARQSGYNALASGVIRADNNAQKWASRMFAFGG